MSQPACHIALVLVLQGLCILDASLLDLTLPFPSGNPWEQSMGTTSRKLLQDSSVCGFNEYFCGGTGFISDTAYTAVSAGNCFNDTGKVNMDFFVECFPALLHDRRNLMQMCFTAVMLPSQWC